MAGVAPPETARSQGNVDSGWPWPPVALGWRAACNHILPCTPWVLSALRSHQSHHLFHLLALWVFDLSYFYQKKCKYRKTPKCWKFLSQKNRPCWFSALQQQHVVTHHTTHPVCYSLSGWASALSSSSAEPGGRSVAPVFAVMTPTMCSLIGVFLLSSCLWNGDPSILDVTKDCWLDAWGSSCCAFIKCQYIFFMFQWPYLSVFFLITFFLLAKFLSVMNCLEPLL